MSAGNRYFTELDYVCWERLLLLWLNFYNYLKKKKKKKKGREILVCLWAARAESNMAASLVTRCVYLWQQ